MWNHCPGALPLGTKIKDLSELKNNLIGSVSKEHIDRPI